MNWDDDGQLAVPSWATDGFGLQGETFLGPREFRPQWDTDISVYDVKDAGQNCCPHGDCPPPNPRTFDISYTSPYYTLSESGLFLVAMEDCTITGGSQSNGLRGLWQNPVTGGGGTCGDCSNYFDGTCICDFKVNWFDFSDFGPNCTALQLVIDFLHSQGDSLLTPDGWWMSVQATDTVDCFTNCIFTINNALGYVFLGSDDTIFNANLTVPLTLTGFGACTGQTATFSITLHPGPAGTQNIIVSPASGTGYTVGDALTFTDGISTALVHVTSVGVGPTGGVDAFSISSNTFTTTSAVLFASGGTGSGATFQNVHLT